PSAAVADRTARVRGPLTVTLLALSLAGVGCASSGPSHTTSPTPAQAADAHPKATAPEATAPDPAEALTSQAGGAGVESDAALQATALPAPDVAPADDPRTPAEIDYAAIYGGQD